MTSAVFILFAAALAVVVIIVAVANVIAARKNELKEDGDQPVFKSLFQYLVLFATLMMAIGGSVSAFMALADIVSPEPYYQTFESYKEMMQQRGDDGDESQEPLGEEELRQRYDTMVQAERENQRARAFNWLIKSLGWIVIPLPIFLYYQRRLR